MRQHTDEEEEREGEAGEVGERWLRGARKAWLGRRTRRGGEQGSDRMHERTGGGGAVAGKGQACCEMSRLFNSLGGDDYGAALNVIGWVRPSSAAPALDIY